VLFPFVSSAVAGVPGRITTLTETLLLLRKGRQVFSRGGARGARSSGAAREQVGHDRDAPPRQDGQRREELLEQQAEAPGEAVAGAATAQERRQEERPQLA
jgi:hypothetical protein